MSSALALLALYQLSAESNEYDVHMQLALKEAMLQATEEASGAGRGRHDVENNTTAETFT